MNQQHVDVDDQGFQLGLAVFETALWRAGELEHVDRHWTRLEHAAGVLGVPWPPPGDGRAAWRAFAQSFGPRETVVRATLTRGKPGEGARLVFSARTPVRPDGGALLAVGTRTRRAAEPLEAIKTNNRAWRVLEREAAARAGAFDALVASDDGDFLETTIANLFVCRDGRVLTPSLERGPRPGVIRELVLEALRAWPGGPTVREARVEPADLRAATEIWITNSVLGVVAVRAVLGRPTPELSPSAPLLTALRERAQAPWFGAPPTLP